MRDRLRLKRLAALLAALACPAAAWAGSVEVVGRWAVDDPTAKFSSHGKLYRAFDITPCGKDFCSVSVEGHDCGQALFRVPATLGHDDVPQGVGKWGDGQLKLFAYTSDATLYLLMGGPRYEYDSRVNNMPTFAAAYHRIGEAVCKADAPGV